MKLLLTSLTLVSLAGCVSVISLPVVGKLSDGRTAQGNVSVSLTSDVGTFETYTIDGLSCSGQYNSRDRSNTIRIPVDCNSGANGVVLATRDASGIAGTAQAKLSNGLTGRFLFGNVSAQQQAEFLNN